MGVKTLKRELGSSIEISEVNPKDLVRTFFKFMILLLLLFLVGCVYNNLEVSKHNCDIDSGNPNCICEKNKPYKRLDIPEECKKNLNIINIDSPEVLQCEKQKDCVALDLLNFDETKCNKEVIKYRCWRQPIFT